MSLIKFKCCNCGRESPLGKRAEGRNRGYINMPVETLDPIVIDIIKEERDNSNNLRNFRNEAVDQHEAVDCQPFTFYCEHCGAANIIMCPISKP